MPKKSIKWAVREKKRSVTAGVGKSFLKTITEPVTNADSILKKKARVPHAAGLIDGMLALKVGDRVDSAKLKAGIAKAPPRTITVEITTVGVNARRCRVIDNALGMSLMELEKKFGDYASAKAKGEKTRSLFGRGALDVLLYHQDSVIFSVSGGRLSSCRFYWDKDATYEPEDLGPVTPALLRKLKLPPSIIAGGTCVEFRIKDGTHIPQDDQIVAKLSSFYMLRLIASDPNTTIALERTRQDGVHTDNLRYDFPIGTVLGRFRDTLDVSGYGRLPIDIMVARADVPLVADPDNVERRENGLLFVDENDAVLDLTLTGDFDKSPYLRSLYGIVRITGIRGLLESKLEDDEAEAVLTSTRDGFDRRHPLTHQLFKLVEGQVRTLYDKEQRNARKSDEGRSEELTRRFKDALKAFNQFNADETEETGDKTGDTTPNPPAPLRDDAIYFNVETTRLHVGLPRRLTLHVNLSKVPNSEIVLLESTNPNIKIAPDSAIVEVDAVRKTDRLNIPITVTGDVKGEAGSIEATTLDRTGAEQKARLEVRSVDDPPNLRVPQTMEFTLLVYSGNPNRENKATLLVNLDAFTGMPEITFFLEDIVGNVSIGGTQRLNLKVNKSMIIDGYNVARLTIPYDGTGWGQRAVLYAKAKLRDGTVARTKCRLKLEHETANDKFSEIRYEDLERDVLGDVAENVLYINAGYPVHRTIFGDSEADFNKRLETSPVAQLRAASILVETVIYHAAVSKWQEGGKKGLQLKQNDPIGSVRGYVEESRMKLEPKVVRALVREAEPLEEAS